MFFLFFFKGRSNDFTANCAVFEAKLRIFFRLNQVNCGDVFKKSFYINKSTNQINQIKYAANNLQ